METDVQPTQPKSKRRWYRYGPQIFVVLASVLIFTLVNWWYLADYFVHASQGESSYVPQINLLLIILVEATVLVFILRLVAILTGSGTIRRELRWYQFSLRSLLVFMLLSCVVMSFVMCWLNSQKDWRIAEANRSIKQYRSGDSFIIGSSSPKLNLYEIEALGRMTELKDLYLSGPNITDETLPILQRLNKLERLNLNESVITDMGLVHLSKLANLQILHVRSTSINGIGFIYLKNLKQLQILDLTGTKTTDAGLEHLKMLTQLKQLVLSETKITDAGLEHLKNMTSLECLYLKNTKVTDAGLEYLKGLNRLYWLDLQETKVTNAGIKDLKKALPIPLDIKLSESPSPDDN